LHHLGVRMTIADTDTLAQTELRDMVASGELAIVSAGFRCFTKTELIRQLGIQQESLAFDSGFFPPQAVARMLESDTIDLTPGHTACIKTENYQDAQLGKGIRFERSTYAKVDQLATDPAMRGLNHYLDTTFGYYTVDEANGYILAHYNWHRFGAGKGGRVHDVPGNIVKIGAMLTKRLDRIKQKCRDARAVLMVVGETQGYDYMMIDDAVFPLGETGPVDDACKKLFGAKCQMVTLADVATPQAALDLL